jgi:deoxyadenosine/deoxycytidine kinase
MLITIEGNIGAGKSTLLRKLIARGVDGIQEPVEAWKNCNGQNLLEAFYNDPKGHAYCFQSVAFLSRLSLVMEPQAEGTVRVIERSPMSDYCFASNCFETGLMNSVEWAAYKYWWETYQRLFSYKLPNLIIYLRIEPKVCLDRMRGRNRGEESGVPLEYLEQIHQKHEEWLSSTPDNRFGVPVLVTDGEDIETIMTVIRQTS